MKRRKKQILPDNRISSVLIALILFFVFWVLGSHQAWFHSSIIPTPHKMWVQLTKMLSDRSLWNAIVFSFRRVLFGYLLGAASGVFLGILIGLYRRLNQLFLVLIGILRPIPPIVKCSPKVRTLVYQDHLTKGSIF